MDIPSPSRWTFRLRGPPAPRLRRFVLQKARLLSGEVGQKLDDRPGDVTGKVTETMGIPSQKSMGIPTPETMGIPSQKTMDIPSPSRWVFRLPLTRSPGKVRWLIFPRMMEVAGDIYEKVRRSKEGGGPPKATTSRAL